MAKLFFDVKNDLKPDGALRDFYIFDVSQSDWDIFISVASETADHFTFESGGVKVPLPSRSSDIALLRQETSLLLSMSVSGVIICCHFFTDSEIELDFLPGDIQNAEIWKSLQAFLQKIVDRIGKKGIITYENMPEWVIDEILPSTDTSHQG